MRRDGIDATWSTFSASIGTPYQTVRLLPSISGNAIWPVLSGGCTPQDPPYCSDVRGGLFNPNLSSTWSSIGSFGLGMPQEDVVGFDGINASFGSDIAKFGFLSDILPAVVPKTHQIMEGIATKDVFVGMIGLSPHPMNLSAMNSSSQSLLASLKNQSMIPSLSWGYTAGATYRSDSREVGTFGSLTLGGYDGTRFVANNVTFPFGPDIGREFLVGLQRITSNISSSPILSTNTSVILDTAVPDIWLPVEACDRFEKAFGLQYNATANQYYANHTVYQSWPQKNPQLSFEFVSLQNTTLPATIVIPFASFILLNTTDSTNPSGIAIVALRQAKNATQYTMGRTFFQEAYIIADYERSNFSISQAVFPNSSMAQDIVAIRPPGDNDDILRSQKQGLSHGATAGIAVGTTGFIVLLAFLLFRRWRRPRVDIRGAARNENDHGFIKPELSGVGRARRLELSGSSAESQPAELTNSGIHEIQSSHDRQEMPTLASMAELPSPTSDSDLWPRLPSVLASLRTMSRRSLGEPSEELQGCGMEES